MSRWRPPPVRSLRLTRRGLLLLGAQAGIMGALAWRMRALQVEDAQRYRLLAEENRINIRLLPPARGQIFDRAGQWRDAAAKPVSLATYSRLIG